MPLLDLHLQTIPIRNMFVYPLAGPPSYRTHGRTVSVELFCYYTSPLFLLVWTELEGEFFSIFDTTCITPIHFLNLLFHVIINLHIFCIGEPIFAQVPCLFRLHSSYEAGNN